MVQRLYPTPFEFAAHYRVSQRLKRTPESWQNVLQYADPPVDPTRRFFHYNPMEKEFWKWREGSKSVAPETLEGIALHALVTIHCGGSELEIEEAKLIFNNLRRDHGCKWGLTDLTEMQRAA